MPFVLEAELFGFGMAAVLYAALHMAITLRRRKASGLPQQGPVSVHRDLRAGWSPRTPVMVGVVALLGQLFGAGLLLAAVPLGLNRFGWIMIAMSAPLGSLRGELLVWILSGAFDAGLLFVAGVRCFKSGADLRLRRDVVPAASSSATWPLLGGSVCSVLVAGSVQLMEGPPSFDAYLGYVAPALLVMAALLRWAEHEAREGAVPAALDAPADERRGT